MDSLPTLQVQNDHVSIRSFTQEDIPESMLNEILEAARRSPTSSNMQAYSIIVVRDPEVKKKLAVLAGGQKHIEACPVFLAFCADLHRLNVVCEMHEAKMTNNLETFLISSIDASLVGMSVQTGAESVGLGGVMIGAMRNKPKEVGDLLGLPPHVYVTYGMCLGWPEEADIPPQKPRLPANLVIHHETYDPSDPKLEIRDYDAALKQHYEGLGKNLDSAAWTGVISRSLSRRLRSDLLETLEEMGFNLTK